jgi:hypothetical protein
MIYSRAEIVADLQRLRRGRGIEEPDIQSTVGRALSALAGLCDDAEPAQIRKAVAELLRTLIDDLPGDLARVCIGAYGLDSRLSTQFYGDRIDTLAKLVDRDPRTVHRQVRKGTIMIAEFAVGSRDRVEPAPFRVLSPWRTAELRVVVALDLQVPEVYEFRQIVAERDDLDLVDLEVTLPQAHGYPSSGAPSDLGLDVLYGGVVTDRVMKSSSRVGFDLRPPGPLRHGDRHDYAFRITMPPERPMAPYYVCTPRFPCDLFRLIVRFGPGRVPASVWRLDAVPSHEVDDPASQRVRVHADDSGEVVAEFTNLERHRSYGFAWAPVARA